MKNTQVSTFYHQIEAQQTIQIILLLEKTQLL